ncbi:transposase [Paraburkholderia sp. BR10954]|uniref:IS66 family transposase n=1 Tax=Paraburkholderia sp. BR10954 TaxID=3236995 RepID=UPI0034D362A2
MTTCRYTGRPPSIEAGIELDRATLASWVREAAALLQPLSDALGGYVRAADKIHTDDTPVPVLEPGRGKTRTARLWTYVRDDGPAGSHAPPAVWYRYSPDRKGERPQEHLAGYTGILQADAFSGYVAAQVMLSCAGGRLECGHA